MIGLWSEPAVRRKSLLGKKVLYSDLQGLANRGHSTQTHPLGFFLDVHILDCATLSHTLSVIIN